MISTQGEGQPPERAKKFYDYLHQADLDLSRLKYSVLALGDSAYPLFCQTGMDVDERLHALGARRIVHLQKCDVDFEDEGNNWFEEILNHLKFPVEGETDSPSTSSGPAKTKGKKFYAGTIKTNINLNDRGSNKQTFHIEIGTDEPIAYEAGDALGIIPANKKVMVDLILSLTGAEKQEVVQTKKVASTIEDLLINHLNICYLLPMTVQKYGEIVGRNITEARADLVDLVYHYPITEASQFTEVLKILSPIAPRLYSISSSPLAHGDEDVHLTVSRHSFRVSEEQRFGLCSDFLGELPIGTKVNFYIHKNREFKLPDPGKDIIMVGPGTGVAPFRAFLAERDISGATGRNWLFFGDQHFTTDFLYQTEMQSLVQTGVVKHLSLAFSRDQVEKVYVQDRMQQHGKELFEWLEDGAILYICGTKDPNSIAIERALLNIIEEHGQLTSTEATGYLELLIQESRYVKDVY